MNIRSNTLIRAAAAAGLGMALLASPVLAQKSSPTKAAAEASPPPSLIEASSQPAKEAPQTGPIISVNFTGGTLRAYVDAVRQAAAQSGRGVNIIVPKEAEQEEIGSISLAQVSVATALQALSFAFPDSTFQVASKSIGSPGDQSLTFAVQYANRRVSQSPQPGFQQPPQPRISRVYSLRSLVEMPDGLTPDPSLVVSVADVLSALQAAAELEAKANDDPRSGERGNSPPEFLLHKDSNLLICRGTENQQRLVESMLSELRDAIMPKRARAAESAKNAQAAELQKITIRAELEQAEIMFRRCEDQVVAARTHADQVQKLTDAGQASSTELVEAKQALMMAQHNTEQAHSNLEATRARFEVLAARQNAMPAGSAPVDLAASSSDRVEITYEIKDLESLWQDLYAFCKQAIPGKWDQEGVYSQEDAYRNTPKAMRPQPVAPSHFVTSMWKNVGGKMTLRATPDQHKMITQYLNTVRRAKANEPNLPGLNAEQMMQDAGKKE